MSGKASQPISLDAHRLLACALWSAIRVRSRACGQDLLRGLGGSGVSESDAPESNPEGRGICVRREAVGIGVNPGKQLGRV